LQLIFRNDSDINHFFACNNRKHRKAEFAVIEQSIFQIISWIFCRSEVREIPISLIQFLFKKYYFKIIFAEKKIESIFALSLKGD
jgi:hypothetical protein